MIEPRSLYYPGRNLDTIPTELLRFPVRTVSRFAFRMEFGDCVSTTAVILSRILELGEYDVIMQAAAISVSYCIRQERLRKILKFGCFDLDLIWAPRS